MRRSTNSYIFSPRSVTLHPIGCPSRSLKFATDFLALVTTAFCPVIISRSLIAVSKTFEFSFASPTPMLITTLSSFGTCIIFLYSNFFCNAGTISFKYVSFNLATLSTSSQINQSLRQLLLHSGLCFYHPQF